MTESVQFFLYFIFLMFELNVLFTEKGFISILLLVFSFEVIDLFFQVHYLQFCCLLVLPIFTFVSCDDGAEFFYLFVQFFEGIFSLCEFLPSEVGLLHNLAAFPEKFSHLFIFLYGLNSQFLNSQGYFFYFLCFLFVIFFKNLKFFVLFHLETGLLQLVLFLRQELSVFVYLFNQLLVILVSSFKFVL